MEEWRASGMFEHVEAAGLGAFAIQLEDGAQWRVAWITPGTLACSASARCTGGCSLPR